MKDQWLRLKLFVCKRIPLQDRQFHVWSKILIEDKRFSSIMRLISIVMLLPTNTASCERGFSLMNQIKSKGRAGLVTSFTTDLMTICTNGGSIEEFDPQPAVNEWTRSVKTHRRPGVRKEKPNKDHHLESESDLSDSSEFYESCEDIENENGSDNEFESD